jgi:hypothetical protein
MTREIQKALACARSWVPGLALATMLLPREASRAGSVDFNRDIRPLLSDRCFKCHGPSAAKGDLRLDQRETGLKALSPGDDGKSELERRIDTVDEEDRMPPPGKAKPLTEEDRLKLRAWLADGAPYSKHWAYVKPVRPPAPDGIHPVDYFVRERLRLEGLKPAAPAAPETLCRRLHLDLVGLPPSPDDVKEFVRAAAGNRAAAVESLVDQLLASPRFGEKWARHWLDLARYGDSAGYQHDDDMPLWPYRDWVIRAINGDMPFERFTIEQVAGDLLPGATTDQRIATGFNRGATVTLGADQNVDELRAQLVWDRVNTVGTTWLAASLECAQCHAHKFDPITQADYYRIYASFNRTVPELRKEPGSHYFITGGILEMPAAGTQAKLIAKLRAEVAVEVRSIREHAAALPGLNVAPLRRIAFSPPEYLTAERVYYYLAEEFKGEGPKALASSISRIRALGAELLQALPPSSLVLEEDPRPPATHVLLRGNVRTPGEEVEPGVIASLHALPKGAQPNRLGLAQWLVSPDNPLTARAMVNRWWAELFGAGIVATPEDFGLQGESPSHPELLDWLAVEFIGHGWSMKHMIKRMVMSETYQQDSRASAEARQRDPQNRLLTRGPRHRLDAELLRDNALSIAGLLTNELGGKPVSAAPGGDEKDDAFVWRRGIYVRQQRGAPYATFASLDAPDRFACTARRPRTNTPLQALALLNEPVFVDAAAALAKRVLRDVPDENFHGRLERLFQLCLSRSSAPGEQSELAALFEKTKRDGADEIAAWTLLSNVMLNLDETLTKE